ncbi:MAG: sporulation protein YunB [Acetanaerobacterium sp.]
MRRIRFDDAQRLRAKLLLSLIIVLAVLILFDMKMRPVVNTFSEYQAKVLATAIINEAVCEELENDRITYNDLVAVSTDDSGAITAVQTNAVTINILKSRLTSSILEGLSNNDDSEIKINLGTLFGGQFFVGRGPAISFRIAPASEVSAQLVHAFEGAGINQTRHRILLQIDVAVTAMIAGHSSRVQVPCNFLIIDTIIVGKVPDSFTEVTGDDSSLISKLNDYGD